MQRFGRLGQIEVTPRGLLNKAKLMQVHIKLQLKNGFIMPLNRWF
jgi:hypothetical protein